MQMPGLRARHHLEQMMTDRSFKYLFIAPAFLLVSATVLYPLLYAIWTSFREWRLSKSRVPTDFVWLDNYARAFFDDPAFWQSVFTTGIFIEGRHELKNYVVSLNGMITFSLNIIFFQCFFSELTILDSMLIKQGT